MSLISRLESRFGRWAIPNVTMIIIAGQMLLFFASRLRMQNGAGIDLAKVMLLPGKVLSGEVWRLVTFVFYPPGDRPLFVIFYCILFYLYGSTMERTWGTFRYNVYLLIAYVATVLAMFVIWAVDGDPGAEAAQFFTMAYTFGFLELSGLILGSVFLAFARRFPDFTLRLFFIIPIRIKWLALLMWIGYGLALVRGDWRVQLLVLASITNYLMFFSREHIRDFKQGRRRRSFESKVKAASKGIRHQCEVCELNSENSPKTLFRYCSKCEGQRCYCPEHIQDHEHIGP